MDDASGEHIACLDLAKLHLQLREDAAENAELCSEKFKCSDNWGDNDNNVLNGCNINIQTDVHNCGSVGNDCTDANKHFSGNIDCVNGDCVARCESRYDNCDKNDNDCETDLTQDSSCGDCSTNCREDGKGGGCNNGQCCWNGTQYTKTELNNGNCCSGLVVYKACDKNIFHDTRYTCGLPNSEPTLNTGGWCSWSKK